MKLKTTKGNIQLLAEGQGGLLFQKQVSGEEWQQDIIDDNVLGGYYYNYAKASFMPDRLGEKSPWYRAMVQNTNNTIGGLRIVPYDRNTIYLNASAGSLYHHVSKGLSKISVNTVSESVHAETADYATEAETAGYATEAGQADDAYMAMYVQNIGVTKTFTTISNAFTFGHIINSEVTNTEIGGRDNPILPKAAVPGTGIIQTTTTTTYNPHIPAGTNMYSSDITFLTKSGGCWRRGTRIVVDVNGMTSKVEDSGVTEIGSNFEVRGVMHNMNDLILTNLRISVTAPNNGVMCLDLVDLYQDLFDTTASRPYILSAFITPNGDKTNTSFTPSYLNCDGSSYRKVWIPFPENAASVFYLQIVAYTSKTW